MSPRRRPRLASIVLAAALAFPAALALPAGPAAAQASPLPPPSLSANGAGEVKVVPDIAIVTIGVVSRANTAAGALAANSSDLQAVIDAIRAAGVQEKDTGTTGFAVTPVYQTVRPPSDQPPPIIGYSVSNNVTVTIRDVSKSGAILDQVIKAGANRVSGIVFDISDRKSAEDQAMKDAIAEARHRGELMAEASGVRLVRVLAVNASANGGGPIPAFAARDSFAAQAAPPPVLPGQQRVTAQASVTWEIAGK